MSSYSIIPENMGEGSGQRHVDTVFPDQVVAEIDAMKELFGVTSRSQVIRKCVTFALWFVNDTRPNDIVAVISRPQGASDEDEAVQKLRWRATIGMLLQLQDTGEDVHERRGNERD